MSNRIKTVIVMAVTALVTAVVAPAIAAITLPRITVPTVPNVTLPTQPSIPGVNPIPLPGLPTSFLSCPPSILSFCTQTWGEQLQDQLQALADAAGLLPTDLLNMVLNLEVPTPDGAIQLVTMTVQQYIDQVANHPLIGGSNTGFLGTPEVAVGTIVHSFGYARTYGSSAAARPYPTLDEIRADMPQYRVYRSKLLASTPAVSLALAGSIATPIVNGALCGALTPPTTSATNSTLPSNCRVGLPSLVPLPVTLPIAIPQSVLPTGTYPPALLPKLPTAIFSHMGGLLTNIQGGGWDARGPVPSKNIKSQVGFGSAATAGARHTGGNSSGGTNLDTATKPTILAGGATLDPIPFYLPLISSNPNVGAGTDPVDPAKKPTDTSIDFLGFGTPASSSKIECKSGSTTIDTQAKLDALARGTDGNWPDLTCTSVGSLTGDGISNFSGWPIDFHDNLPLLWTTEVPSLDAANASIAAILATLPTSQLQTYGLLYALTTGLPYVLGLPGYSPLPDFPLPTVPTVPTVPVP